MGLIRSGSLDQQLAHPGGWTNLGTAGGELPAPDPAPDLEPNAGPDGGPAYTATESGQSFGGDGGVSLFFEDWTVEIWMKRLEPAVGGGEHQFLGFIDAPWPFGQCIILRFDDGGSWTGHRVRRFNARFHWRRRLGCGGAPLSRSRYRKR